MNFEAPALNQAERDPVPTEAMEAIERRLRTAELEERLEHDKTERPAAERSFALNIIEDLKKRGGNALRITLLSAVLGIGNSEKLGHLHAEEAASYSPLLPRIEESQAVEKNSMDLTKIAESSGFNARVDVISPSGTYIIHIGQIHRTPESEQNAARSQKVAYVQRDIEKVLVALAQRGTTNVFTEGYVQDHGFEFMDRFNKSTWEKARGVSSGPGCFEELARTCKEETKFFAQDRISSSLVLTIKHIFQQRAFEMKQELEKEGALSEPDRMSFETSLASFKPTGTLEPLGDDAIYYMGANEKLQEEGVIKILPAETKEGNEAAFKYTPELNKASAEYFNAHIKEIPIEKTIQLRNRYDSLKKLDEQATYGDREDIAITKISEYAQKHPDEKLIPLVFGDAHDFKDNIEKFNETNAVKFGLIRLTPTKDTWGVERLRNRK